MNSSPIDTQPRAVTVPLDLLDNPALAALADRADEAGHHEIAAELWRELIRRRNRTAADRAQARIGREQPKHGE